MRTHVALLVCLASASTSSIATAQTATDDATLAKPGRYVQAGVMVGVATPVVALNMMGAVDAGVRLGEGAPWLHLAAGWGATGDDQGTGSNLQLRVGIEGRSCWVSGAVCTVGGVDAGYQRGRWTDLDDPAHSESVNALVAIPRFGFDLGGTHLRARFGIELDVALLAQRDVRASDGNTSETSPGVVGLETNAGLAYQW